MPAAAYWWVFGFVSALFLIAVLDQAGIHPGAGPTGLTILAILFAASCVNAVKHS